MLRVYISAIIEARSNGSHWKDAYCISDFWPKYDVQMMETPFQSCSKSKGLPGLPPLPALAANDPSDLYQVNNDNMHSKSVKILQRFNNLWISSYHFQSLSMIMASKCFRMIWRLLEKHLECTWSWVENKLKKRDH